MPQVTKQEAQCCMQCKWPITKHRVRMFMNTDTGKRDRYGGEFYACRCGALTFGDNGYNQRED